MTKTEITLEEARAKAPKNAKNDPCGVCVVRIVRGKHPCKKHLKHLPEPEGEEDGDGPGRPSKLTPEIILRAETLLEDGDITELIWSDKEIDVSSATWARWWDRGLEDLKNGEETLHAEFCRVLARAEGHGERRLARLWRRGAVRVKGKKKGKDDDGAPLVEVDWRAVEAYLKRWKPARWADRVKVEGGDGPVELRIVMGDEGEKEDGEEGGSSE